MSLINVNGQVDQNAAAQLAAQLAQIIQAAPNTPEKTNVIRGLAALVGVSTPEQNEDNDNDENRVDYRDEHEYVCHNDGHDDGEHRIVERPEPFDRVACGGDSIDIDQAIDNVDDAIEKLKAVKQTLRNCKDNGGEYVIWNNDDDFDYETGDPEDI